MTKTEAIKLRRLLLKAAELLQDDEAAEIAEFYPAWKTDTEYQIGDKVRYNDGLYRCLQAHTSQSDWHPDITPALWSTKIN